MTMTAPRIQILPDHSEQFVQTFAPEPDSVQEEMAAVAQARGDRFPGEGSFPTVGQTVGGWLYHQATQQGIDRVFEFGSGFGYSAYWLARALPADGELSDEANAHTRGVYQYLQAIRSDQRFRTRLVSIGGGLAVSRLRS